jgi:2-keto-4-pentenoate hydratase/2-oxohepta-3-ene-1,7-dioic acid hydratase in catechol pathway
VPDPGKILCIGKNYADHAAELGSDVPTRPEVFMRARTSLAGPYQPLQRPFLSEKMDYEVELAVVIGRSGRHLDAGRALEHVAGYCVFNDISMRDFQHFGQQWTPGKNFDGSGPLGPFLTTADEVPDPQDLRLTTTVRSPDGSEEVLQDAHTSLMVHQVAHLLAFLSQFTTLEPGDIVATGTPAGVGDGRRPPRWLLPGETLISSVERLGKLENPVVAEVVGNP